MVGKIRGEWKILDGSKKLFSNVLHFLAKLLRSLAKIFCALSQNQLSLDKLFLFTLQLAVVTACMFTMERFIEFCFELRLNKVVQGTVL